MNVTKLPFYFGLFFALLGIAIITVQVPRVLNKISYLFESERVTVWAVSKDSNRLSLERNVFKFLNYRENNGPWSGKWDILWSVEYPFIRYKEHLRALQTHQRINHFPGLSDLTIKKHLATKVGYDFIPRGFTFPSMKNDFRQFTEQHPDARFVEKYWNHRGVKLAQNINFESFNAKEKFLQVFVERPYLIDNRVFDIALYVVVTSFDPLRVYKLDKEILLRFCSEDYHPFSAVNTKQYVVDDSSVYVWSIESLRDDVMKLNYTAKAALEAHMKRKGHDMTGVWTQMDDAITKLLLDNERNVVREASNIGHPALNFFELLRFDFILDESLKVHLMEVNMSPNLTPRSDYADMKRIYRSQLLHDTLNLVGANELKASENDFILSDERDVTNACCEWDEGCGACMTEYKSQIVHRSYREHVRRGGRLKRIFPVEKHFDEQNLIARASTANILSIKWFQSMCRVNKEWC